LRNFISYCRRAIFKNDFTKFSIRCRIGFVTKKKSDSQKDKSDSQYLKGVRRKNDIGGVSRHRAVLGEDTRIDSSKVTERIDSSIVSHSSTGGREIPALLVSCQELNFGASGHGTVIFVVAMRFCLSGMRICALGISFVLQARNVIAARLAKIIVRVGVLLFLFGYASLMSRADSESDRHRDYRRQVCSFVLTFLSFLIFFRFDSIEVVSVSIIASK